MSDILTGSSPRGNAAGSINDRPDQHDPPTLFDALYRAVQRRDFREATRLRRALGRLGWTVVPRESAFSTATRPGGGR